MDLYPNSILNPETEKRKSERIAESFLKDVLSVDQLKSYDRIYMREGGSWETGKRPEDLGRIVGAATGSAGDWYVNPHSFLPNKNRSKESILQLGAIVIDFDDGRPLAAILEAFDKLGIQPHYTIQTRPGRYQAWIKIYPRRLGKDTRTDTVSQYEQIKFALYDHLEADPRAKAVTQFYRIPGSRRRDPERPQDHTIEVTIVHRSEANHRPYSLNELDQKLKARYVYLSEKTNHTYTPTGKAGIGRVLESPPIKWILSNVIDEGSRHDGGAAIGMAARLDHETFGDVPIEKAFRLGEQYQKQNTTQGKKPYKPREAAASIRCCYRKANPYGLNHEILMTIRNTQGETMSKETALSIYAYLPEVDHKRRAMDLEDPNRKNFPLIYQLERALDDLARMKRHDHPTTVDRYAQRTGIPRSTVSGRIWPIFHDAGLLTTTRGQVSILHPQRLTKLTLTKIMDFIRAAWYRLSVDSILRYWKKRFYHLFKSIKAILTGRLLDSEPLKITEAIENGKPRDAVDLSTTAPRDPPDRPDRTLYKPLEKLISFYEGQEEGKVFYHAR